MEVSNVIKKKILEFELDPILQLVEEIGGPSIFKGIPNTKKERNKQKDGIISQSGDYNQIIKRNGHYYGILSTKNDKKEKSL